jgi:hypothetical protein
MTLALVGYDPPRTLEGCECPCHKDPSAVPPSRWGCCLHAPVYKEVLVFASCPECGAHFAVDKGGQR